MRKTIWLLVIIAAMCSGCNDDCVPEPMEPVWKRFEGIYNVTNLENQEQYNLKISFDTLYSVNEEYKLHIIYENFDDSYDTLIGIHANYSNPNHIVHFNAPFGVADHIGHRWSLVMVSQDTLTPELENTLVNDTILFYFRKSNIAFYAEDGVPYYDCYCKHLAVKVE